MLGGKGVSATSLTRVGVHACSCTTINKKDRRQRCAGPNDNPIDVGESVAVVPTGGLPTVGLDNTVGDVGCYNKGLHQGQLGKDESLSGRWLRDSSHGSDSFMMVGVAATTMIAVGTASLWHNRRSIQR